VPQGIAEVTECVPELIEQASIELPGSFRILIDRLFEHLRLLDRDGPILRMTLRFACEPIRRACIFTTIRAN
jgi:hypothetical protein